MEFKHQINGGEYTGERALFMLSDAYIKNARFFDGESPLKESRNLEIYKSVFEWKYPLWYAHDIVVKESLLTETARSGIWYTDNIRIECSTIKAPKTFRKASHVFLRSVILENASETFWFCKDVKLENVKAVGDYFMMGVENGEVDRLELDGNYFLDGAKNVTVRSSTLNSKDSFWNTENVTVVNSKIVGEYIGWNSKNLTFINCEISSLQALCYIDGLRLINCKLTDSTLCLEYCSRIDATIIDDVISIKNPTSGMIRLLKGLQYYIVDNNSRAKKGDVRIIFSDGHEI